MQSTHNRAARTKARTLSCSRTSVARVLCIAKCRTWCPPSVAVRRPASSSRLPEVPSRALLFPASHKHDLCPYRVVCFLIWRLSDVYESDRAVEQLIVYVRCPGIIIKASSMSSFVYLTTSAHTRKSKLMNAPRCSRLELKYFPLGF